MALRRTWRCWCRACYQEFLAGAPNARICPQRDCQRLKEHWRMERKRERENAKKRA